MRFRINRASIGFAFAAATGALCIGSVASAVEVTVQNDTLMAGQMGAVCPCFVAGEEAAVWLESPCDGGIVAIQVFWQSFLGGAKQRVEDAIFVYSAGTFPNPGPVLDILEAPLLTDGFLNEFRFRDKNMTDPIFIPIQKGETFVVSLRFFNPNENDFFAPSVVSDANGCQAGKNTVKTAAGWFNACQAPIGISGDWVIRAVIDCGVTEPTGACCLPDGSCVEGVTATECASMSGTFQGALTVCSAVVCPQPTGACCFPGGGCLTLTEVDCAMSGVGIWQGPNTMCPTACACDGDTDGDTDVDVNDISYVVFRLGNTGTPGTVDGDANGDGSVNVNDISYVVFRLGTCNPV